MLIDKDAATGAIRRLEIDGPQMIWSSDAIDAVQGVEPDAPNFPDLGRVIDKLSLIRTWASCRVLTRRDCSSVTEILDEALKVFDDALALIEAQRRTLDEIDKYVRELDKAVNGE